MGRLTDGERDAYEEHFLACDRCAAELEAVRRARDGCAGARLRSKTHRSVLLLPILALPLLAWTPAHGKEAETMALKVTSPAFAANASIPVKHTCDGADLSPPLAWTGVPEGAKSLAVVMDDPDAPVGTWVHWVLYDLPPTLAGLPEGVPKKERLEGGGTHGACWGVDRFSRVGYSGPCPPPGAPHHYHFRLYALDRILGLPPRATKADLLKAMKGHVLAEGDLVGTYGR